MERSWDSSFESTLRASLPALPPGERLPADAALAELGLDSLNMIGLVGALEDAYDVEFPADRLTLDSFATPQTLWLALAQIRDSA